MTFNLYCEMTFNLYCAMTFDVYCAMTFGLYCTFVLRVPLGELDQLRQDVINLRRDLNTSTTQQDRHRKTMTDDIRNVHDNLGVMENKLEDRHVEVQTSAGTKHVSVSSALRQLQEGLDVFKVTTQDENQQLSKEVAELKEVNQNCQGALSELQKSMSRIAEDLADLRNFGFLYSGGGAFSRTYQSGRSYQTEYDVVSVVSDVGASLSGSNLTQAGNFDNGEARPIRSTARRVDTYDTSQNN